MTLKKTFAALLLAGSVGLLSACDSAEERAQKYYESGMEYLAKGDVDRALVEFRNVFKLDGRHKEARLAYAKAEEDRGNLREAYGQYLRVIEQYPGELDALRHLGMIAVRSGNWAEARRHIDAAEALAPNDEQIKVERAMLNYGLATENSDAGAMVAAAAEARKLREQFPDDPMLRRIVIDDLLRGQNLPEALAELDAAIAQDPTDSTLFATRLSVYAAQGEMGKVEQGLIEMVKRFPDAPEMSDALVRWYVSRKEFDKAEAHLRAQLAAKADDPQRMLELIRFLAQFRGSDQAVAELDKAIAAGQGTPILRSTRAGFLFDSGKTDEAIAEMRAILKEDMPADSRQKIKVGLARMEAITGNQVGARALVEEVLNEDSGDVEAIKLKAGWLILDDNVGEAITILRTALGENPRDAAIMTLMAQAYERDGNRDLMREMLAAATEASGKAPEESLRYAQFLAGENKLLPAEGVLLDALRLSPGNMSILVPLGDLYISMKDWPRAETVARQVSELDDPNAKAASGALRAAILAGQEKTDEAMTYLEDLASDSSASLQSKIAVVRGRMANGQVDEARAYLNGLLAESPDDPTLRFLSGALMALTGDVAGAEGAYRTLVTEDKARVPVWMALFRLMMAQPEGQAKAATVLDEALAANPDQSELLWAKAGLLEREGKIDEAIKIYEALYAENSANPIVANNLASLLSSYRSDPESLAKAEVIARRLRGSDVGAYQDTYGWIAHLRGNHAEALGELQKAATNLPDEPMVHFHLGKVELALGHKPEALRAFQRALKLTPEGSAPPYAADAQQEVEKLVAEGVTPAP